MNHKVEYSLPPNGQRPPFELDQAVEIILNLNVATDLSSLVSRELILMLISVRQPWKIKKLHILDFFYEEI